MPLGGTHSLLPCNVLVASLTSAGPATYIYIYKWTEEVHMAVDTECSIIRWLVLFRQFCVVSSYGGVMGFLSVILLISTTSSFLLIALLTYVFDITHLERKQKEDKDSQYCWLVLTTPLKFCKGVSKFSKRASSLTFINVTMTLWHSIKEEIRRVGKGFLPEKCWATL